MELWGRSRRRLEADFQTSQHCLTGQAVGIQAGSGSGLSSRKSLFENGSEAAPGKTHRPTSPERPSVAWLKEKISFWQLTNPILFGRVHEPSCLWWSGVCRTPFPMRRNFSLMDWTLPQTRSGIGSRFLPKMSRAESFFLPRKLRR